MSGWPSGVRETGADRACAKAPVTKQRDTPTATMAIGVRSRRVRLSPLEQEPSPELDLSRAANARYEPGRLPECRRPGVASIRPAEVRGVEHIEGFDEETYLLLASK